MERGNNNNYKKKKLIQYLKQVFAFEAGSLELKFKWHW